MLDRVGLLVLLQLVIGQGHVSLCRHQDDLSVCAGWEGVEAVDLLRPSAALTDYCPALRLLPHLSGRTLRELIVRQGLRMQVIERAAPGELSRACHGPHSHIHRLRRRWGVALLDNL